MRIAVPVTPEGHIGAHWGKAPTVAVAVVEGGAIESWIEHEVRWDRLHDEGTEGSHHARVVRFLRDHEITHVMVHGMGQGMQRTLGKLGITIVHPLAADAREAACMIERDLLA